MGTHNESGRDSLNHQENDQQQKQHYTITIFGIHFFYTSSFDFKLICKQKHKNHGHEMRRM